MLVSGYNNIILLPNCTMCSLGLCRYVHMCLKYNFNNNKTINRKDGEKYYFELNMIFYVCA